MDESATDGRWSRIAALRPRLRDDVRVHRHRYRGRRWYVLHDPLAGQWRRLDSTAYRLVRLLDGRRSVEQVLAALDSSPDAPAIRECDVVAVLDGLSAAELVDWGLAPDAAALEARHARARRAQRLARLRSPFSIRIRLGDPDAVLEQQRPLTRVLFGLPGAIVWMVLLAAAAAACIVHWDVLSGYWSTRGFTPQSLLALSVVYVLVKVVHEAAHALATKRWGGEVHEVGVMLLLLMPVPYVDASAAWTFPEKSRRMLVGAAGIMAELALAAIAVLVFVSVETGAVRDFAYGVMLVGSVSTLLFNGNPLLRFDGYYVLADAVEIPNLAPRSTRYWAYLAQRYLLGVRGARSPVTASGERGWFVVYGAAACLYRVGITLAIALLVASELPVLGVLLGAWAIVGQIAVPLARQVGFVLKGPALTGRRVRALTSVGALAGAFAAAIFFAPMPLSTHAEGVVWLPEHANVRAGTEGTVLRLLAPPDARVDAGSPLAVLDDPLLDARIHALEWELAEIESERAEARLSDRVKAQVLLATIAKLEADLAVARAEAAERIVVSPVAGALIVPRARHLVGRHVKKGEVLAYVLEDAALTVRVAVPQSRIGQLRRRIRSAQVRLVERPYEILDGVIERQVPSATHALPSAALGALGGGAIAVDPGDDDGLTSVEGLFLVDVVIPGEPPPARVGGRAHVRFQHGEEPLGYRLYRGIRRLLLERLAV